MGILAACFGWIYDKPNPALRPPLPPLVGRSNPPAQVTPPYRRVTERTTSAPDPIPLPCRRISQYSAEAQSPSYPSLRRVSEPENIGSPIHDTQIKVTDAEKLLSEVQHRMLKERMQEVHTFFDKVFGIEAVAPDVIFPPINGYKKDPDNAEWSNNVKIGWRFGSRSLSPETVAHEYIHAIVQRMTNLDSKGEEGALNESLADVFASIFKQTKAGENVKQADWQLKDEGKSYRNLTDFPTKGNYPNMAGEVHHDASIPNYAFYTAAMAIGGNSVDVIGKIWCEALKNTKSLKGVVSAPPFKDFAQQTIDAAKKLFPQYEAIVRKAWTDVGVDPVVKLSLPSKDNPITSNTLNR